MGYDAMVNTETQSDTRMHRLSRRIKAFKRASKVQARNMGQAKRSREEYIRAEAALMFLAFNPTQKD